MANENKNFIELQNKATTKKMKADTSVSKMVYSTIFLL